MIFFELDDQDQSVTNDQFASIHDIVADDLSRDYVVEELKSEETSEWYVMVTRMADGDQAPEKKFHVETDGEWWQVSRSYWPGNEKGRAARR